jgi:DNA-cytosine methyltransferase
MLRHVDLCSGIGGFSLGFEWAGLSKPVLFCDIEPWSRKILNKHWPDVPIAEDVKELANDPEGLVPECDIITAGYPCQPFSVAGSQKGEADPRHIWPYIFRIIAQRRPTWVVCENVYGHVRLGLDKVLTDLETEGYTSRTFIVPACGINAPHKRDRLWIVGYTKHNGSPTSEIGGVSDKTGEHDSQGQNQTSEFKGTSRPRSSEDVAYTQSKRHRGGNPKGDRTQERILQSEESEGREMGSEAEGRSESFREDVADTNDPRNRTQQHDIDAQWQASVAKRQEQSQPQSSRYSEDVAYSDNQRSQRRVSGWESAEWEDQQRYTGRSSPVHGQSIKDWWSVEPNFCRVAHGVPNRVDRIKGLGNAIVPQIAMQIGLTIKKMGV